MTLFEVRERRLERVKEVVVNSGKVSRSFALN